jgi:uncharacterized protein YukE
MNAEESAEELTTMLSKLTKEAKKLPKKLKKNESKARKRISNLVEMSELMIESFRIEYSGNSSDMKQKNKEFHAQLDRIKADIEHAINKFFQARQEEEQQMINAEEMDGIELIQMGDKM